MNKYLKCLCFILLGLSLKAANAQDIIITTKQTEIEAKVVEVDTDKIKYRLYSHLDGPLYNILKKDVFMIIYENGKREMFTNVDEKKVEEVEKVEHYDIEEDTPQPAQNLYDDNKYSTSSNDVGFVSWDFITAFGLDVYNFGMDYTFTTNFIRAGMSMTWLFDVTDDMDYYQMDMMLKGGFHLPINKLSNSGFADAGLFPFAEIYYGYVLGEMTLYIDGFDTIDTEISDWGHKWRFGVDYYFNMGLGITVSSNQNFDIINLGFKYAF